MNIAVGTNGAAAGDQSDGATLDRMFLPSLCCKQVLWEHVILTTRMNGPSVETDVTTES
jgi:hypothetical protein